MRDGAVDEGHGEHGLARLLRALLDGLGDLVGLAVGCADVAFAVTDDHDRAEAEATTALDHLRDAVDVDDLLAKVALLAEASVGHVSTSSTQNLRPASRAPSATAATRPW